MSVCLSTNLKMFLLSRFSFLLKTELFPHLKGCSSQTWCNSSSSEDSPICADPPEAVRPPFAWVQAYTTIFVSIADLQFFQRTLLEEKNFFVEEHKHLSLPQKPLSISRSYQVNTATGGVSSK